MCNRIPGIFSNEVKIRKNLSHTFCTLNELFILTEPPLNKPNRSNSELIAETYPRPEEHPC